MPGEECLLRAICEHATTPLTKHNGFVGDIMHVILSPFASKHEKNMEKYYEAELNGKHGGKCTIYNQKCKISILDLISKVDLL